MEDLLYYNKGGVLIPKNDKMGREKFQIFYWGDLND